MEGITAGCPQITHLSCGRKPRLRSSEARRKLCLWQTELGGVQIPTADGVRVLHDPLHPSSAACTRAIPKSDDRLHTVPLPMAYEESTACLVAGRQ